MTVQGLPGSSRSYFCGRTRVTVRLLLTFLVAVCTGCTGLKQCAYEGFNRDSWQQPDQVIRSLNLQPGDVVADLGSGSGYFTFRLADAVGPDGKVYAVDIDQEMNELIAKRAREEGYDNVRVVLARPHDPGLPESGMALVFSSNTYHHLENRTTYFSGVAGHLRPDGRIAILDFNGEGWFHKLAGHWTEGDTIRQEMKAAGYSLERTFHYLPKQNFLIFSLGSRSPAP